MFIVIDLMGIKKKTGYESIIFRKILFYLFEGGEISIPWPTSWLIKLNIGERNGVAGDLQVLRLWENMMCMDFSVSKNMCK